jgi:hypothetical protein
MEVEQPFSTSFPRLSFCDFCVLLRLLRPCPRLLMFVVAMRPYNLNFHLPGAAAPDLT